MVPTADNTTNRSDEAKERIMGMKNNQAAGTDLLQGESFKFGGNEVKKLEGNCEQVVRG